jgi:hypothetical protein
MKNIPLFFHFYYLWNLIEHLYCIGNPEPNSRTAPAIAACRAYKDFEELTVSAPLTDTPARLASAEASNLAAAPLLLSVGALSVPQG